MFLFTESLHAKDKEISHCCEEKLKAIADMMAVYGHEGALANVSTLSSLFLLEDRNWHF